MNKPLDSQQRPRCGAPDRRGPSAGAGAEQKPSDSASPKKEKKESFGASVSRAGPARSSQGGVPRDEPVLLSLCLIVAVVLLCLQVAFCEARAAGAVFCHHYLFIRRRLPLAGILLGACQGECAAVFVLSGETFPRRGKGRRAHRSRPAHLSSPQRSSQLTFLNRRQTSHLPVTPRRDINHLFFGEGEGGVEGGLWNYG